MFPYANANLQSTRAVASQYIIQGKQFRSQRNETRATKTREKPSLHAACSIL